MNARPSTVALVNPKSGGRRAALYVLEKLKRQLGEDRVFTLFSGPDPGRFVEDAQGFLVRLQPDVVIIAGGDGTISFGMDIIKDLHDKHSVDSDKAVVAPFPLGTGNDLSYTLGYGGGFARWFVLGSPRFRRMMHLYEKSKAIQMDRWRLSVTRVRTGVNSTSSGNAAPIEKVMNNYFSVGFDAAIAGRLNAFRQRHPMYFLTRPMVKLWYAFFAVQALLSEPTVADSVEVSLDGRSLKIPANTKALVVANMITYAGGSILWGPNNKTERSLYQSPSLTDGKVEVAALSGVWHLAFIRLGLCYATKLGQGERVRIVSSAANHHQYDGETLDLPPPTEHSSSPPSKDDPIIIEIRYLANADVLQAHLPRRHIFSILATTTTVLVVLIAILHHFFFVKSI